MDHAALIRRLGGAKALADALRNRGVHVEDVTARSWTLAGRTIPAKYWVHVVAIAADAGEEVPLDALAASVAAPIAPARAA